MHNQSPSPGNSTIYHNNKCMLSINFTDGALGSYSAYNNLFAFLLVQTKHHCTVIFTDALNMPL